MIWLCQEVTKNAFHLQGKCGTIWLLKVAERLHRPVLFIVHQAEAQALAEVPHLLLHLLQHQVVAVVEVVAVAETAEAGNPYFTQKFLMATSYYSFQRNESRHCFTHKTHKLISL